MTKTDGTRPQGIPTGYGGHYGSRVQLYPDGKYRWIYEYHMMKNPIIIFVVYKIFGGILLVSWAVFCLIFLEGGEGWDGIWGMTKVTLLLAAIFFVLIPLGYTLTAATNGWKYVVLFEMDDNGLVHRQMQAQVKKAKAIGWLTVLAGLASGNPTTVGIGLTSATKTSSVSNFAKVRSVKSLRRWNTIKVNEPMSKNQVYVEKEDFDFVYQYIVARCPKVRGER